MSTPTHRAKKSGKRRAKRSRTAPIAALVILLAASSVVAVFAQTAITADPPSRSAMTPDTIDQLSNADSDADESPVAAARPSKSATEVRAAQPIEPVGDVIATSVPESGSGSFDIAGGQSGVTGQGEPVTYSVEVERGLAFKTTQVARTVDEVLADERSWTAVDSWALQRVDVEPSVRIRVATPETTDKLCAPLNTGGRLSCRNGDLVVLNAWRWMNGAPAYLGDLASYRRYMINHEFGHALGVAHATCPAVGQLASVMVQQTKGLQGCLPNPWPAVSE